MLTFYIKSAIRSIRRKKDFFFLNITGLAIGMSVLLLTMEYYSYETGFNTFHAHEKQLYRVNIAQEGGKTASTMAALAPSAEKKVPGIKKAIRFGDNFNSGAVISYLPADGTDKKTFREEGAVFADKEILNAFTFPLLSGSNQLDKPNTVIITAAIAGKIFGHSDPIGKIIELHNQFGVLPCTVTGVISDIPKQSDLTFDYLFSMESLNNAGYTGNESWAKMDNWGSQLYSTFLWIDDNAQPGKIAAGITKLYQQNKPGYTKADGELQLQPLSEIHLGKNLQDTNPTSGSMLVTYFILALGLLVLCIAWINYINFSTAQAISEAKNIGIHKIIGSRKTQIIFRFLTETFLLNISALLLSFIVASLVQPLFNYATGKPLSLQYVNHPATWLIISGIIAGGILICGLYVGSVLSKFKPLEAIRLSTSKSIGNILLRKGLVVFQFVISILFITATIVVYRQLQYMKHSDLGMNIDQLYIIKGPAIKDSLTKPNTNTLVYELEKLPFVEKLSLTGSVPGIGYAHNFSTANITRLNPSKGDEQKNYAISLVDEHYYDAYQIKLIAGRNFRSEEADRAFKGEVVAINETAAKELGLDPANAVNQSIRWNDKQYQVVALVKDYHHRALKEKIEPIIFIPQHNSTNFTVKLSQDNLTAKIDKIKSLYTAAFPGNPFDYQALRESYDTNYNDEQKAGTIAASITILVIFIACLGLVGLSVFTAKRRTKEIGIRKVLGASMSSLFRLLSKEFIVLVGIAFVIAVPIAYYALYKWLQNFAFRTSIELWVFAVAGVTIISITLLTVSFQSLKVAGANPIKSLRTE